MPFAEDYINLEIINDKQLRQLFTELQPAVQNKVVLNGMRSSAAVILQQAKQNFKSTQKGKSTTGYKYINRSFTTEPLKGVFGLKVGIKNYKMRWLEWGTSDRYYKKGKKRFFAHRKSLIKADTDKHFTGKIQPTNFFYGAVASRKDEAQNNISTAIIASLEATVKKYENANT